mmetsp:Transcript_4300/g.10536  ORF Transcript_4300/g.10536 Transcript_4300/m.10536 type:complete len:235 (+) Transcript_4300:2901-3605(+)
MLPSRPAAMASPRGPRNSRPHPMTSSAVSVSSSIIRKNRYSRRITAALATSSGNAGTCSGHFQYGLRSQFTVDVVQRAAAPLLPCWPAGGAARNAPKNTTYGSDLPLMSDGFKAVAERDEKRSTHSPSGASAPASSAPAPPQHIPNMVCIRLGLGPLWICCECLVNVCDRTIRRMRGWAPLESLPPLPADNRPTPAMLNVTSSGAAAAAPALSLSALRLPPELSIPFGAPPSST